MLYNTVFGKATNKRSGKPRPRSGKPRRVGKATTWQQKRQSLFYRAKNATEIIVIFARISDMIWNKQGYKFHSVVLWKLYIFVTRVTCLILSVSCITLGNYSQSVGVSHTGYSDVDIPVLMQRGGAT